MVGIRPKATLGFLIFTSLAGFAILTDYSSRPSLRNRVETTLTALQLAKFQQEANESSILLFFHPHCPCTMATARSLVRLHSKFAVPTNIHAYAFCPETEADRWVETEITKLLRTIPGLEIHLDRNGDKCRQYGVNTSGDLLVYSAKGQLIFCGGISMGRGHEGESISSKLLVKQINEYSSTCIYRPVFGCPIIKP